MKRICQSRKLAELKTDGARLLYTWLIPNVDINGCFSGDPEVIKGQVFTRLKKSPKVISGYLEDLESVGLIAAYETNGDVYLQIPDFKEKQPSLNPKREAESTIPPPTPEQLQSNSRSTPGEVKQSKVKSKESKKLFSPTSDEIVLSELLFDLMIVRKPDFKKPNIQSWAKQIDLMIRIDKRAPDRIRQVIKWCQSDSFWCSNILSTNKLRKQFDRLELRMIDEYGQFTKSQRAGTPASSGCEDGADRRNCSQGSEIGTSIDA